MTGGKRVRGRRITATAAVAKALGIRVDEITATGLLPQVASTGAPSLQVPIRSMKTAREMEPDMPALATVLRRVDPDAGAYVFAFEAEGSADLHARSFFPQAGIPEDPATGIESGASRAELAENGRLTAKMRLSNWLRQEVNNPASTRGHSEG